MAFTADMMPELVDPSGFDKILGSNYEPYHGAQLAEWGLPVRPAMNHDKRKRQAMADQILRQNELASNLQNVLANQQQQIDIRGQDVDLAKNMNSSFDTGNDQGMMMIGPNREIMADPDGLDAILGSGDDVNRWDIMTKGNKQQAEADTEQQRADAATLAAQNAGSDGSDKVEAEYNSNGDLIGFKIKGAPPGINVSGNQSPTVQTFTDGNNPPMEIPSAAGTGKRLIKNSDGSGTVIMPDGTKQQVSKENMAKYGF
jgi:hypothetical protein